MLIQINNQSFALTTRYRPTLNKVNAAHVYFSHDCKIYAADSQQSLSESVEMEGLAYKKLHLAVFNFAQMSLVVYSDTPFILYYDRKLSPTFSAIIKN